MHGVARRHRLGRLLQAFGRDKCHDSTPEAATHNTRAQRPVLQAHAHRLVNLRAGNAQLIAHRHKRLRKDAAGLLKSRQPQLVCVLQQVARATHQRHIVESVTHPAARERTGTPRVLQGIQRAVYRRVHQVGAPRLRGTRIHTLTGEVLRQSIAQETQAQGLRTCLGGRAASRKSAVRQLVRGIRINHQKAQTVLGDVHSHRLNRKVSEIHHKRLLRERTQRRRLIQAARLRTRHLILGRDAHLSQAGPQRVIIGRGCIRFRAVRAQGARKLKQCERRRALQRSRGRQATAHRNARVDEKIRAERVGEHDVAPALLIHRPGHARHVREPTLQMARLDIAHHNRALVPRHLQ